VLHHQADLVAVAGEHDARRAAGVADGDHVAVPVGADLVGVRLDPVADDVLDGTLESGGAGSFQEVFQKGEGDVLRIGTGRHHVRVPSKAGARRRTRKAAYPSSYSASVTPEGAKKRTATKKEGR